MSNAGVLMCPVCASLGGVGWLFRQFDRVPYALRAPAAPRGCDRLLEFRDDQTRRLERDAVVVHRRISGAAVATRAGRQYRAGDRSNNAGAAGSWTTNTSRRAGASRHDGFFVYPQAWPTHIQWAAMLLVLLCGGAGNFSLDAL